VATRLSSPTLIGRQAELARLEAAMERAAAGQPGVAIVAGEAGVGKTRLVEAMAARAGDRGRRVLVGGCVSLSAEVAPFAAIIEALRPLTRDLGPDELGAVLGPRARELAPLLPDLERVEEAASATGISPDTSHGRLLELLLGALTRLAARQPVVLIVEDIHWADRSTIDVLAFLARSLRSAPVLLVITYRTDEPGGGRDLLPLIAELSRREGVERIELRRLNRAEVGDQLSAILGVPAASSLTEAVFGRSEGNAFFSEELLAAETVAGALPPTLRDVLTARLAALSPEAQELARMASAAGRRFTESTLSEIAGVDVTAFGAALREAIHHQILVRQSGDGGDRLAFRHSLMQEVLHGDLLPSERRRLHTACALVIEERIRDEPDDAILASELAYHWQAADEPERALPASISAGLAAESAGAQNEAAVQFERALALLDELSDVPADLPLDRVGLLERAAANLQGDPARAVDHITKALRLVRPDEDPAHAGTLHAALGRYLWESGDATAALAACREAVRLVPAEPPSVARARVAAGLGQILMIMAHSDEGVGYSQEAVRIAAQTGARAIESHALDTLGILTAYLGDVEGGLAMLWRSLEIAQEIASVDDISRAYGNITDVLIFGAGRYDEAGDLGMRAIGPADEPTFTGVPAAVLHADIILARYLAGRWDDAAACLARAHLQPASGAGEIALGIRAAQLAVGRGEFEVASSMLAPLVRQLENADDMQWIAPLAAARAELAIWKGDPTDALRSIDEGLTIVHLSVGANVSRIGPILALGVRAAADLGGRRDGRHRRVAGADAAREKGAAHLAAMRSARDEVAARWPVHIRLADPHLALCEAEATRFVGRGDPDAWAEAARQFEVVPQPYTRAYARFREGTALLAAHRDVQRARSALREAHQTAVDIGAAPLQATVEDVARRGRVELTVSAAAAQSSAADFALTAREQEILGLLAIGLTNREIAERLFITEKTAGHHVSNILAKLGVSRRAEAAAEAVRLGIATPAS
jgi:DNA-binding CsgD family transcriptional regulator/tetratricopeptide (TPR) repeat protein